MKRVLFMALVLSTPSWAAFPGFAYDQYQDFHACSLGTPTPTCLANSATLGTGSWSVTNVSSALSIVAAPGVAVGPNGSQYSGNPSTNVSYIEYTPASAQSKMTLAFFYRTNTCTVSFAECNHAIIFNNNSTGDLIRISDEKDAVNNNRELRISDCNGGTTTCEVDLSHSAGGGDNLLLWICFKYDSATGIGSLNAYNAITWIQVGSSATYNSAFRGVINNVLFGNDLGALNATTSNISSNIAFDWTNAAFPLLPSPLLANSIYIAQTAQGGTQSDGSSCANAFAVSYYNTAANWGSTVGKIGPGTTVHLCGTITTSLVAQGGGASGNPIILQWESGASVTSCDTVGSVRFPNQNFFTIDLGANSAAVTCPTNGSPSGTLAIGITDAGSSMSNIEIRNGTVGPMYVHTGTGSDGQGSYCINVANSGTGNHFHLLTIDGCERGMNWVLGGVASTTNEMDHNTFTNRVAGGIWYADGSAGNILDSGSKIHDNDFTFGSTWTDNADLIHMESIHIFNQGGAASQDKIDNLKIYNNYFHGTQPSTNTTAFIFLSNGVAGCSTNAYVHMKVFNNIFQISSGTGHGDGLLFEQDCTHTVEAYNNTFDALDNTGGICWEFEGTGTGNQMTWKNNVCMNSQIGLYNVNTGTNLASNNNIYFNIGTTGLSGWEYHNTNYVTLAAYQVGSGIDASSSTNNPGLNTSYVPTSGASGVVGAGVNLTSLGISELSTGAPQTFGATGTCGTGCLARPGSAAWDLGAYPLSASAGSVGGLVSSSIVSSGVTTH